MPDFLDLDLEGSKVIVGGGPMLDELKSRYPEVHFTGYLEGEDLARAMAAADVFVFPSRTDTFGLVMIEALASGVPVAAYDVPGPRDIVLEGEVGAIGDDLGASVKRALACSPARCRAPRHDILLGSRIQPVRNLSRADPGPSPGTAAANVRDPTATARRRLTGSGAPKIGALSSVFLGR